MLCLKLAIEQLKNAKNVEFEDTDSFNLSYLLKCANIFVQTENDILKEKGLRIAQYAMEFGDVVQKEYAYIILDLLLNIPSINLSKKHKYIDKNIEYYMPLKPLLQKLERENNHSFKAGTETIICNSFQKKFTKKAEMADCKMLSISAPTSSGKSFIVLRWLINNLELENNNSSSIAIIVPTRALINQYEKEIKRELANNHSKIHIETLSFRNGNIFNKNKLVYIFTQERMSAFLSKNPNAEFNVLFIDEAQKIGDNQRGVLLETIIEKISECPRTKIIFASPFANNPSEVFADVNYLKSELMTINQNFYKIKQEKRKPLIWNIYFQYNSCWIKIGKIHLNETERIQGRANSTLLSVFANIISAGDDCNNLIYASDANEAENIANLIYSKSNYDISNNADIQNLIELCKEAVHNNFSLNKYLEKGIAFHCGSMPQTIRAKIEELFDYRTIRTLICTSTLLEGVNLSCKNIFMRNPKRSRKHKMSDSDVFNLAGRAGRLGKEFYGNIFYVDWDDAPTKNEGLTITRTVQRVLRAEFDDIIKALNEDFDSLSIADRDKKDSIEATIGYLYTQFLKLGDIGKNQEVKQAYTEEKINKLNLALFCYSKKITIPKCILEKHPTVYHLSMQKLLQYFKTRYKDNPEEYLLNFDDDEAMKLSLFRFLKRMSDNFNTPMYSSSPEGLKFIWYIAILTKQWLKFRNLNVLIDFRWEQYKDEDKKFSKSVRKVFKDIDEYCRYLVPKLLRCYIDVLNFYLEENGYNDLMYSNDDIEMLLEYGIENKTQMSMITLGLSRSTIVKLFDLKTEAEHFLVDDIEMDEKKTLFWLKDNIDYIKNGKKIPKLLVNEIESILETYFNLVA